MPLPRPDAFVLSHESALAVPVPDEGLTAYRLLRGAEPQADDFEPSWTRPQGQLRGIPELFRTSVSHWLDSDQAASMSLARGLHGAGGEYRLGHVDVWGYPRDLLAMVVEVSEGRK